MLVPPFEVAYIDSPHRGLRQLESASYLTGRRAFAGLSDNLFEAFAERRLGGQLLDPLHSNSAFRTSQPMHFYYHRCPINAPGQIADFSFPHIVHLVQPPSASATLKSSPERLSPYPQFQRLRLFVQLMPIHSILRPS
jgi:hypothetical protein